MQLCDHVNARPRRPPHLCPRDRRTHRKMTLEVRRLCSEINENKAFFRTAEISLRAKNREIQYKYNVILAFERKKNKHYKNHIFD